MTVLASWEQPWFCQGYFSNSYPLLISTEHFDFDQPDDLLTVWQVWNLCYSTWSHLLYTGMHGFLVRRFESIFGLPFISSACFSLQEKWALAHIRWMQPPAVSQTNKLFFSRYRRSFLSRSLSFSTLNLRWVIGDSPPGVLDSFHKFHRDVLSPFLLHITMVSL